MKNTIFAKSILILTVVFALPFASAAQTGAKPVRKDRLISVLRQKAASSDNIIAIVRQNGVDFVLTDAAELELRAAGADDDLISAIRASYRGGDSDGEGSSAVKYRDAHQLAFPVKQEKLLETLAAGKLGEEEIIPVIEKKGVDFKLTPALQAKLRAAGASPKLIAAVRENYRLVTGGVLNGKALNLSKPSYPAAARAVKAQGAVNVLVVIDEQGTVIDAGAITGHVLLREAAENAALASKFSPTLLKGQKIKITGIIVYNFVAQ